VINILWNAAKQREGNGSLDIFMSVNRGGDGFDNSLSDPFITGKLTDFFLVLFSKPECGKKILLFVDMVCFNNCREYREPILRVKRRIEIIAVDSCDFLSIKINSEEEYIVILMLTTSSPGLTLSIKSQSKTTSRCLGKRPAGTEPGDSCSVNFW
jgi:hypothetical protein